MPLLLFLVILVLNSNTYLSAQFSRRIVDTCRYSCNEYDLLADYVEGVTAILEVSVDSVIQIENRKEESFWIYFKVHDVLNGSFPKDSFRIFSSSPTLVKAIIEGYEAMYGPPGCGNTFDGIRNIPALKPKIGYAGLIGVVIDGLVTKLELSDLGIKYDFGDEPEVIGGEVNYAAIKGVVSLQHVRPGEQTIFSSREELQEFLEELE